MNDPTIAGHIDMTLSVPDPYQVELNLPPAVRRAVRLARIEAYERTPALRYFIPGERIMLEFDQ